MDERTSQLLHERFGDDVASIVLAAHVEPRGRLVVFDAESVPFVVRRIFAVSAVPAGERRGGHRHRTGVQLLTCLAGRVDVELRKQDARLDVTLTPGSDALMLRAGVWSSQRYVESGSVLLVLASEPYDPASYERLDEE